MIYEDSPAFTSITHGLGKLKREHGQCFTIYSNCNVIVAPADSRLFVKIVFDQVYNYFTKYEFSTQTSRVSGHSLRIDMLTEVYQ